MNYVQVLSQYWGLIASFIGGVVYVAFHYQASLAYAKKKAISLMFVAEKKCESLVLNDGASKLKWVTEEGYNLIPAPVRLIVSKPMFQLLAQEVYDSLVGLAKDAEAKQTQPEIQPTQPETKPATDVNAILKDVPLDKIQEYVTAQANANGVQQ